MRGRHRDPTRGRQPNARSGPERKLFHDISRLQEKGTHMVHVWGQQQCLSLVHIRLACTRTAKMSVGAASPHPCGFKTRVLRFVEHFGYVLEGSGEPIGHQP